MPKPVYIASAAATVARPSATTTFVPAFCTSFTESRVASTMPKATGRTRTPVSNAL